jgi:hypothetical protein
VQIKHAKPLLFSPPLGCEGTLTDVIRTRALGLWKLERDKTTVEGFEKTQGGAGSVGGRRVSLCRTLCFPQEKNPCST